MKRIIIDLETRSDVDIAACGNYRYALSEEFRILLLAYKVDDAPAQIIDLAQGESVPRELELALRQPDKDITLKAHNAGFEYFCLNAAGYTTDLELWKDTMVMAAYAGYPQDLKSLGAALGLPESDRKLSTGTALISYFCKPMKLSDRQKYGRLFHEPEDDPAKWQLFKEYCLQDVETEAVVDDYLSAWEVPEREWQLWRLDIRMNCYGVGIDREMLEGALKIIEDSTNRLTEEAKAITGLANPNSPAQLRDWLHTRGVMTEDLTKSTVQTLLDDPDTDPEVRRMLEIRQELGKASLAKYSKIDEAICPDERIRGISRFYGAGRTGRYSGKLVQMQNLPKNYMEGLEEARELVKIGDYETMRMVYGNVADTLSQLIRTVFIPAPGHKFVVADFSAIEARVLAWLAGETWVLEAFAAGKDIYCETASMMYGVPVVKHGENGELRQKGKVATLACGYQGGVGAMKAMDPSGTIAEEEMLSIVERWRTANPRIVNFWHLVEDAAIGAVACQSIRTVGIPGGHLTFRYETDPIYGKTALTVELPTGRKLHYVEPYISENRFGRAALHFLGLGGEDTPGARNWGVKSTYGGSMVENITQAIARDCLAEILLRIQQKDLQTVFHVHDEVILDCLPEAITEKDLCDLMAEPIPWAPGLQLKGAGFESQYYMKD